MGGTSTTSNTVSLARLATDTGGRFTERTNDLTLGLARAQRDLTCSYALGFYVDGVVEDKVQRISVKTSRPGLRAIHASKHMFRSEEVQRESKLRAAWFAPEQFQTGLVQAYAFPVRPDSRKRWDTLLSVSFPIPLDLLAQGEQTRDFGAVVTDGQTVLHRFTRRLTVRPENLDVDGLPRITFLEPVTLKPGQYTLTAVMNDPDGIDPHAATLRIDVPEIPRRELFLVGPILARTAGPNLVVLGRETGGDEVGSSHSFEPLLVQMIDEPQDLLALTQACMVGKRGRPAGEVARSLRRTDGELVGSLPDLALDLEGETKVRCQNLLDVVPATALADGDYVFEARLSGRKSDDRMGKIRFSVGVDSANETPDAP